jgi:hypothetical protein
MAELTWEEIGRRLRAPFKPEEIEWRVAQAGESSVGKPWAKVLAYLTNRAIMQRLDDVVGCGGWENKFQAGPHGGVICGISIMAPPAERTDWHDRVTKWDGADNTDIESVKGGLSDSMKRAAVQWGMGRYLYALDEGWADCSTTKQSGPEWHWMAAKGGKYASFYWRAPELPQWALPEGAKAKTRRSTPNTPEAGVDAPAPKPAAVAKPTNPYGIPPEAWLKLDACKSYDEVYKACTDLREDSRGANPAGENWNVALNRFFKDRKAFFDDMERAIDGGAGNGQP